jgi:gas vesicle protein
MGVFIFLTLISIIITQKILSKFFSRGKNINNFKFNSPDFAEIGVLVNSLKKLNDEVTEIKKALASGDNLQKGDSKASDYSNEFKLLQTKLDKMFDTQQKQSDKIEALGGQISKLASIQVQQQSSQIQQQVKNVPPQ